MQDKKVEPVCKQLCLSELVSRLQGKPDMQRLQRDKKIRVEARKPRGPLDTSEPHPRSPSSILFYGPLLAKMPRETTQLSNPTRRSSRLNKQHGKLASFSNKPELVWSYCDATVKNNVFVELPGRPTIKKRKIVQEELTVPASEGATSSRAPMPADRVPRTAPIAGLSKREKVLLQKEKDLQRKSEKLNERMLQVTKMEQDLVCQVEIRDAKAALTQLEEHFICSLCYEVM